MQKTTSVACTILDRSPVLMSKCAGMRRTRPALRMHRIEPCGVKVGCASRAVILAATPAWKASAECGRVQCAVNLQKGWAAAKCGALVGIIYRRRQERQRVAHEGVDRWWTWPQWRMHLGTKVWIVRDDQAHDVIRELHVPPTCLQSVTSQSVAGEIDNGEFTRWLRRYS